MKTVRLRPRLGILFVLAVCLPSAALVVMAVRSIAGEEAVLEKRLERTFTAELDHVVALVAETMDEAIGELAGSAPVDTGPRGRAALAAWAASSDLVGVPFLLTADDRLVEPSPDRELTGDEIAFLRWNEEFLAGSVQTPVYYNVGVAYQQEILAAAADTAGAGAGGAAAEAEADAAAAAASTTAAGEPATIPADAQLAAAAETRATAAGAPAAGAGAAAVVPAAADDLASARREQLPAAAQTPTAAAQKTAAATASTPPPAAVPSTLPASTPAPTADTAAPPAANSPAAVQEAVNLYKQDESVRKRVLEKALSEGATPVERLVQPRASQPADDAAPADKAAKDAERPSIFVTRQRTFKEIQADATSGLLPRVVQDELELLFWVRTADGGTAGCVVDLAQLSARLVARLPDPFTGERILTLLDDRAEPLATPPDGRTLDWRRPFVALELHESLPRWEVASYLADPGLFASQVRLRTSLLWLLVAILVASIGGGGAFVFLGLGHELRAAQQRTTFVANVSHELKTPLTSIRMFAEMLRDGRQADPGRRQRYLDLMVAETGRLTRLVNNVLDFSQLEQGRKRYARRAVDLGELCRGVVDVERPRLEQAGFAVGFAPASEPLRVTADEDALRQVLGNLLSNAEKYSADHREVAVEAGTRDGRPFFAVLDRGIGVAPEHAARIFREFYRVDDSLTARVKGTGLGLSIARRIVRDHGGELTYEPREGGGSVFRAAFPAAGAPPGRGGRRPARPRKAGRDGG